MSSTQPRQNYTTCRKQIGVRLRTIRKEMGLTQGELASRVKLSCGTISTLETGEARREQTLVQHVTHIARALRQDPGWLLTGEHSKVGDATRWERIPMVETPAPVPTTTQVLNIGALQRAGRKIRAGRNAMGITQVKFAGLLGTDPGTLSTIERGYNKTHFEMYAEKCCQVLGVNYDWLFTLDSGEQVGTPTESPSEQMTRLEVKLDRILKHFNIQ